MIDALLAHPSLRGWERPDLARLMASIEPTACGAGCVIAVERVGSE